MMMLVSLSLSLSLSLSIYIYIYIHTYVCMYMNLPYWYVALSRLKVVEETVTCCAGLCFARVPSYSMQGRTSSSCTKGTLFLC